jgi:hexosaminidase
MMQSNIKPSSLVSLVLSIFHTIMRIWALFPIWTVISTPSLVSSRIIGIPTIPLNVSDSGKFQLTAIKSIIVDSRYATTVDNLGQTLIPPSLHDFATTFGADLGYVLQHKVPVVTGENRSSEAVFLTIGDPDGYLDAAGRKTSEGYSLSVSDLGITISGASPLGLWWGTRTILQQAVLSNGSMPYGSAVDSPSWGIRGMMLDAGRHYYPPDFLIEMCAYMSFFKQNTFHLHLSDNLYNNVQRYSREDSLSLYARFRLWSDSPSLTGLNKYKNESYTREQFEEIQSACAARGVTVIPEIEAPGHALVIVQWKPELGREDNLSLLNISQPESIPTMERIWETFLPWFQTKTVHIGADEYTGPADEYNRFVNAMASYIGTKSGKSIRIWGTFPPRKTPGYRNVFQNVSVQHWAYFEDNPYHDYILNNYSTLNSDDAFYVVNKWSGSYPQTINISRTFHGNPNTGNGPWYPYIFDSKNKTNNPVRSDPLVLGEVAALWNDYGANASVYSEAYYSWREGIPALADKQWGGDLSESEFNKVFSQLHKAIPGQNLDRSIPSKSSQIMAYKFPAVSNDVLTDNKNPLRITDLSGNGYHAKTSCPLTNRGTLAISPSCALTTPQSSKGRNYTFTLTLRITELHHRTNATLISGSDSALMLTPNITLFASGNYFRLNSTLPLGEDVEIVLTGRGNQTFAAVSGSSLVGKSSVENEFLAVLGVNGVSFRWEPIAVEAPLRQVGGEGCGWSGELLGMSLSS